MTAAAISKIVEAVRAEIASVPMKNDRYLSLQEAAEFIGRSSTALTRLCEKKQVPYYQFAPRGPHWFLRSELHEWCQQHRIATADEMQRAAANLQPNL